MINNRRIIAFLLAATLCIGATANLAIKISVPGVEIDVDEDGSVSVDSPGGTVKVDPNEGVKVSDNSGNSVTVDRKGVLIKTSSVKITEITTSTKTKANSKQIKLLEAFFKKQGWDVSSVEFYAPKTNLSAKKTLGTLYANYGKDLGLSGAKSTRSQRGLAVYTTADGKKKYNVWFYGFFDQKDTKLVSAFIVSYSAESKSPDVILIAPASITKAKIEATLF